MSALVLLNLLEELGKRDKMRGLPSIFVTRLTRAQGFTGRNILRLIRINH